MGNFIDHSELNEGMYLLVNNGLVEDLGCAFTELTGYSKSDFCQKRISEVLQKLFGFDLDIDELEKSAISEIFLFKKSCEVIEVSIKVCQSEGENHKFYFVKQKPDFILNFELSFIDKLMKDNTENMLKRKYLEEKNEELRKTIEMKDEMLLLISHELKTPLSIITSSIQTLEIVCKNELSEKVRKYLNKIKQNTYRQLKLVNNILDNTRVNAGLFRMNQASVDIVLLTKTIIESITVFAERKGINISFSSTITQSVIHTDVDIYERILLNLLSNAVKFTPEGRSIEVNIFQMLTKENHKVCIEVKDNGIGIPSDQKDLIFERFKRVDRVVVRHSEGTGIGLYLVKMLVSLLEGEIKVESKEGVGSTFSLIFPLVKINKASMEPAIIETSNEKLITATAIEFSDIYYGT